MKVTLPYGKNSIEVDIPDSKLVGVLKPRERPGVPDLNTEIQRALSQPIGTQPLSRIAKPGQRVAITIEDITRVVPNAELVPAVVRELTSAGIREEDITVIVARGLHRAMTDEEIAVQLGSRAGRVKFKNNEPDDPEQLSFLCKTQLGTDVYIDKTFHEADLKIVICDVEIHQFFGYGGGAKSILPGISDRNACNTSHSRHEMDGTGPGKLDGNPVRAETDEAGRKSGTQFSLQVVLNSSKEVVRCFAGDLHDAFLEATAIVDEMYKISLPHRCDLVLVSPGGYPKDIEMYQAQKGVEMGVRVASPGGKVVIVAECPEGSGSKLFHEWMTRVVSIDDIFEMIRKEFVLGGHKAYQYARAIKWADLLWYTTVAPDQMAQYFMQTLSGLDDVQRLIDEAQSVCAIPYGNTTLTMLDHEDAVVEGRQFY